MCGGVTVTAMLSVSVLLGFFLQADNKNTRFSIFYGPGWETDRASKGSPVIQYFYSTTTESGSAADCWR